MSPTSSSSTIYDHLMINFKQQPKMTMRNNTNSLDTTYDMPNKLYSSNSRSDCDNLSIMKTTKSIPVDKEERSKRRYTITHIAMPDPIVRCSVSNQAYDKAFIQKPLTSPNVSSTYKETNSTCFHSPLSKNIQTKQMDFRPLITNGRRRFTTIPSGSPMMIVKKKSPSPMNNISFDQKQLRRSIPVDITSSNKPIAVSTVITSSLSSSSSSSSSSSTTSANVGTVTVPIQVIKTQNNNNINNNNKNNSIFTTNTRNENPKGYRYISKQLQQVKPLKIIKAENKFPLSFILTSDDNGSTRMPSSSSSGGDGHNHNSTIMTDSNVLRLIRRYDPLGANIIGIQNRRSLEHNRHEFQDATPKSKLSLPSNLSSSSCTYLSQLTSNSSHNDNSSVKQSLTPRLQHQQAVDEQESPPLRSSSPQSSNKSNPSIRPILKYIPPPTLHTEINVPSKKTEPLTIEIEPYDPPTSSILSNENTITYQPLITTGTKRVCSAISKSEWDLRLQSDAAPSSSIIPPPSTTPTFPVRSPSPHSMINQQQENQSYGILSDRNKNSIETKNDNNIDDFHENSSSITTGSCVEKLKQLFNTKSSSLDLINSPINKQHKINSIESNLNQHLTIHGTSTNKSDSLSSSLVQKISNSNSIESQINKIPSDDLIKSTTINQEDVQTSSPLLKRPILKSQKAFDSSEILNYSNNNSIMPSSEVSYDAYRFRRLNDHDQMTKTRLRNVAKVEPYSINTNMVRPLYQSISSQPTTTTVPSKSRNMVNSMGNTPTNSSTSSSAASLSGTIRHPNVRHSDFLVPNPAYSTPPPQQPMPPPPPPPSHTSQPLSTSSYATPASSSMLLSESLSHVSQRRLPNTSNTPLYTTGRSTSLASSANNSQQKYRSPTQADFYSGKQIYSPSTYHNGHGTTVNNNNNNKYEKFDNYTSPLNSYHYRPREYTSSTTPINTSSNSGQQQSQGLMCTKLIDQSHHERSNNGQQQQQQQSRRRFQRRKQMKRSKSADLYQESPSKTQHNNNNNSFFPSTNHNESSRYHRQPRSTSRDLIGGGDGNLSSSSSSTSSLSTANIERINRAALLRYKSLDSMTFNNRTSNFNGKNNNRKALSKHMNADFDSDDSVCGIPKPRKTNGR